MIKLLPKPALERIYFCLRLHSITDGSQGGNSGIDLAAELEQGLLWRNVPYWFVQLAFLTAGPPARGGTAHCGLDPPPSNINQESAPQICPWANLKETFSFIFLVVSPLSSPRSVFSQSSLFPEMSKFNKNRPAQPHRLCCLSASRLFQRGLAETCHKMGKDRRVQQPSSSPLLPSHSQHPICPLVSTWSCRPQALGVPVSVK